jgi:hypothetical protein
VGPAPDRRRSKHTYRIRTGDDRQRLRLTGSAITPAIRGEIDSTIRGAVPGAVTRAVPGATTRALTRRVRVTGAISVRFHAGLSTRFRDRWRLRIRLEDNQLCPYRYTVSRRSRRGNNSTAHRRGQLYGGLFRHDLNDDVILLDDIAWLDSPIDDFSFHCSLAEVRQLEHVSTHAASITLLSACAMRAGPGKYSHSKAWG